MDLLFPWRCIIILKWIVDIMDCCPVFYSFHSEICQSLESERSSQSRGSECGGCGFEEVLARGDN